MEFIRATLGLLLLAIGAATGLVLARHRRFPPGRVALDVLGIALGGVIGIAPGAYLLMALAATGATGMRLPRFTN